MIDRNSPPMLLNQTEPEPPPSVPPKLSELMAHVDKRRRNRRIAVTSIGSAFGLCLLAIAISWLPPRSDNDTLTPNQTVDSGPLPPKTDAGQIAGSDSSVDGIEVFATVSRRIPIFERLPDSQHLYHVGWIDSEGIVPVDLSQFPTEQQQSFKAVLNETSTPTFLNL